VKYLITDPKGKKFKNAGFIELEAGQQQLKLLLISRRTAHEGRELLKKQLCDIMDLLMEDYELKEIVSSKSRSK
jgi:hypothetical protein